LAEKSHQAPELVRGDVGKLRGDGTKRQNDEKDGLVPSLFVYAPRMSRSSDNSGGSPLVSVLMPVRGCRDTLPIAVASVMAQTWDDWELLVVRDDDAWGLEWLERMGDKRVRILQSSGPGGRGAARQAGLDAARGELLAFLDADDWMLPERLGHQVGVLRANPDLALVSAGMFVLDRSEFPAGLRKLNRDSGKPRIAGDRIVDAPVLSASSMLRTATARRVAYDVDFSSGEDADFLVRYLRGRSYMQESIPLYCYREYASFSVGGLRRGLRAERRRRVKHATGTAARAACWVRWGFKRVVYELAIAGRGEDFVLQRRCTPVSADQRAAWASGREKVIECLQDIQGEMD